MIIKLSEIKSYLQSNLHNLKHSLQELENIIIDGRDNKNIPVYLTKSRIKDQYSAYLKTKRKAIMDMDKITDLAGLRVLCLFEQDIPFVHDHLINIFSEKRFILTEVKIYNWEEKEEEDVLDKKTLKKDIRKKFSKINIVDKRKKSGYKSIHYICYRQVDGKKCFVEVQLRTLLQDVWGELEHALSYKKGNIHPHIKKSFSLLAKDLQNNDSLMTHLKKISIREEFGESYSIKKSGPIQCLDYEDNLVPELFQSGELKNNYEKYLGFVRNKNPRNENKRWIADARKIYESICAKITVTDLKDKNVNYFVKMEDAYLKFCNGEIDKAMKIYKLLIEDEEYEANYCLNFRMGEIYLRQRETEKKALEKALASFDRSEYLLNQKFPLDIVNKYRIKFKLAFTYWMLGAEYIDFVITEIDEAEKILIENRNKFSEEDSNRLINSLCWYYLERYLLIKNEDHYNLAYQRFLKLKELIKKGKATSNAYDTAAWFYYQIYLKNGEKNNLAQAKKLCLCIEDAPNRSTCEFLSRNIHRNHILEIMTTEQ